MVSSSATGLSLSLPLPRLRSPVWRPTTGFASAGLALAKPPPPSAASSSRASRTAPLWLAGIPRALAWACSWRYGDLGALMAAAMRMAMRIDGEAILQIKLCSLRLSVQNPWRVLVSRTRDFITPCLTKLCSKRPSSIENLFSAPFGERATVHAFIFHVFLTFDKKSRVGVVGYHVCFTRTRSPVRTWNAIKSFLSGFSIFSFPCLPFFFFLFPSSRILYIRECMCVMYEGGCCAGKKGCLFLGFLFPPGFVCEFVST